MTVYTFEPSKHTEGIGRAGESVIGCAGVHARPRNDNDNYIFFDCDRWKLSYKSDHVDHSNAFAHIVVF